MSTARRKVGSLWHFIVKFVVSHSALCKLRRIFGFFCSANHLSGPLRKHMFTCLSSKGHGLLFVIGGSVLFVSCFKVRCFVIILFWAIINQLSLLRRFFWSFFFLSLARIKQRQSPSFDIKIYSPLRFPSLFLNSVESFSAKLGEHVIVICINPAFTKMIDRTEKPKIPLKFAIHAAQ